MFFDIYILSSLYFDLKHLKLDIFMVFKYDNFLYVLEIHLVYVYNLFDAVVHAICRKLSKSCEWKSMF